MAAKSGLSQLSSDHLKLYTSGANADVTFVFPTGEILAHKLILTTRVPYFEKMFASGMKESLTNRVDMPETDKNAFDVFLRYIYGGQLPKDFKVEHQLNFAEMYDVPALISDCIKRLSEYFSKASAMDCINEAAQMMATCKIEGVKSMIEVELIKRIDAARVSFDNATKKGVPKNNDWMERMKPELQSYSDQLVELLILSHSEKCVSLKYKCIKYLGMVNKSILVNRLSRFHDVFEGALKKLEGYPGLLVEIVVRHRCDCSS